MKFNEWLKIREIAAVNTTTAPTPVAPGAPKPPNQLALAKAATMRRATNRKKLDQKIKGVIVKGGDSKIVAKTVDTLIDAEVNNAATSPSDAAELVRMGNEIKSKL